MFVAEKFNADLTKVYDKHSVSTDGERTWYPQACRFLKLRHHIHSSFEKSIIERTMQYIKKRTESFDDYFPCKRKKCKLKHKKQWFYLFIDQYYGELLSQVNRAIKAVKKINPLGIYNRHKNQGIHDIS